MDSRNDVFDAISHSFSTVAMVGFQLMTPVLVISTALQLILLLVFS